MRPPFVLFIVLNVVQAFNLPFFSDFFRSGSTTAVSSDVVPLKIAIIGAGAGGSSAAFWISKAQESIGVHVEVDVYERTNYIGGRSTIVYPYDDSSLAPVELGASIFVKANKNLWRASDDFNLTRIDFGDEEEPVGFWDGQQFVFTTSGKSGVYSWWDSLKAVLRYGISSPQKTRSLVQGMIKELSRLYASQTPHWTNVSDLVDELSWGNLLAQSASEFFETNGVGKRFSREIIESATRVNYAQNSDYIHALGGAVSMAANGASSLEGGNFQLFENFLKRSGAHVNLNTTVLSITDASSDIRTSWTVTTADGSKDYDEVIVAAPIHSTGIEFSSQTQVIEKVPQSPYVHLHVTHLSTTKPHPNPKYFSLPDGSAVPTAILTTFEGARNGYLEPEFNSLTYHGRLAPDSAEYVVKIFSNARLTDEWLNVMFDGEVGWVHRKEWDSYPKLPPTSHFAPVVLGKGLYYVNALETFVSTMETETLAARNIVDLLFTNRFGKDICGRNQYVVPEPCGECDDSDQQVIMHVKKEVQVQEDPEDFVYGFDC